MIPITIPITEEALQRMEKRANGFADGTQTDGATADQLMFHVLTLAGEVRRLRGERDALAQCSTEQLAREAALVRQFAEQGRRLERLRTCAELILEDTETPGVTEWGPDLITSLARRLRRAMV